MSARHPADATHTHDWIENTHLDSPTRTYACTACTATTTGCNTCGHPMTTDLLTCDTCLKHARNVIRDITHDIDTVPFHHAEIMGLRAIRYDRPRVTTSDDDARLPFGLDLVVEDPEDPRIEAAKTPSAAVSLLVDWADAWAGQLGDQIGAWDEYLIGHTVWAATNPDMSGWHDYLREARRVRATVRRILGIAPERQPAPCVHCGGRIVQDWTTTGLDDVLRCTGCGLTWRDRSWLDYANLHTVHALPETHPGALVTIAEAKAIYRGRVRQNLFDLWVHRGLLAPAGGSDGQAARNVRGELVYRLGDIDRRAGAVGA